MNWIGSGFITIISYTSNTGMSIQNAILTEASDEIFTESSDYLQIEAA